MAEEKSRCAGAPTLFRARTPRAGAFALAILFLLFTWRAAAGAYRFLPRHARRGGPRPEEHMARSGRRNLRLLLPLAVVVAGIAAALLAPEVAPFDPTAQHLTMRLRPPRWMAGGPGNPLGARALYLGGTVYRLHGTNQPQTIGSAVSSGCFRLVNMDIIDLYDRVPVGTKVIVRPQPTL